MKMRSAGLAVLCCVLALCGCTPQLDGVDTPSPSWADVERAAATEWMSEQSNFLNTTAGFPLIAARTVDGCGGSSTGDGFKPPYSVQTYSCTMTRVSIYAFPQMTDPVAIATAVNSAYATQGCEEAPIAPELATAGNLNSTDPSMYFVTGGYSCEVYEPTIGLQLGSIQNEGVLADIADAPKIYPSTPVTQDAPFGEEVAQAVLDMKSDYVLIVQNSLNYYNEPTCDGHRC